MRNAATTFASRAVNRKRSTVKVYRHNSPDAHSSAHNGSGCTSPHSIAETPIG
jgi:hypothetical protein